MKKYNTGEKYVYPQPLPMVLHEYIVVCITVLAVLVFLVIFTPTESFVSIFTFFFSESWIITFRFFMSVLILFIYRQSQFQLQLLFIHLFTYLFIYLFMNYLFICMHWALSHFIISDRGNVGWEICQGLLRIVSAGNRTPDPLINVSGSDAFTDLEKWPLLSYFHQYCTDGGHFD